MFDAIVTRITLYKDFQFNVSNMKTCFSRQIVESLRKKLDSLHSQFLSPTFRLILATI